MDYDSDSDGSDSLGLIPPTQQQPVGYNSYGRPSMAMNNNTSYEQDHDSSSSSEDDDDSDAEEAAPPIVPRGKTFRPPVGDGDSSSSSSEDEGGGNNNNNASKPIAQIVHNSNPGVPRGKELRLPGAAPRGKELRPIQKDSDSSDDDSDVPLVTMKSKSKSKNGGNNNPSSNGTKKRKASAKSNDSDSSDDDDDACIATIVGGSDDEDAMATNMSNKKVKTNDGSAKKKPGIKKGATLKKDGTLRRKPGPKKGSHKGNSASSNNGPPVVHVGMKHATPEVSAENATAAQAARIALQQKVTSLPHKVSSSHTIRSFGRIKPEYNASALDALYSSPHAIYPVGFSCDRFEFSPIHGRVIKMRCDILDGRELRERRENLKKDKTRKSDPSEPMLVDEKTKENLGDGPVFRVTFGEGVEEEKVMEPSCPFDPYVAAAQLGGNVDAIAMPLSSKKGNAKSSPGLPEIGMRVSVKFDKGKLYGGLITKVNHLAEKLSKNKKALCNITIKYDDGVTEVAAFPDPDIALMAGCPPVETEDGLVTQMNGKSVRSVLAKSPLEAWGKTLLSLGLIDEIMYESALKTLSKVREEGFKEVKDKIDAANKKRREDRAKEKISHSHGTRQSAGGEDDDKNKGMSVDDNETNADKMDTEKEDQSPEEVELRKKLAEMQNKLEAAKKRSKVASFNLANVRIATISPFAANPFLCRDDSSKLETSWMAAAIKNEKAKMGNTGNKKKFVNPATMLDKSDTFFQPKIERLVEGLPGTEFAPSYVFRANRSSSGGNQTWIHEAKIKLQKQQQKKQEKALKTAKHSEAKAKQEQEKLLKRKLHEQQASDRKRLKEEEENKKKRKRVEKRLALLNNQMSDKLFKEACMMREKNIMNFVRGLNKEFARRRKAAEQTVGNRIDQTTSTPSPVNSTSTVLIPFGAKLPPLSRSYEPEVIRVWDFLHSFSDVFSDSRTLLPSLNSIQGAFDCLKANECDQSKRSNATQLFQGIAIDLCKVISPSLTKILSTSIQNFEVIGKNGTEGGPQEDSDVSCLPVTEWTWREVAKMAIIYDVLTDLGYSKQESANFVKGYRSGGHPKSNEAKRWKKIEESNLVMMYSRIKNNGGDMNKLRSRLVRAIISTPCTSSSVPSDWRFFLHNIKSRSTNSARFIKDNVKKSLAALKNTPSQVKENESYIADLEKCLAIVERSNNGSNIPELHKAKQLAVRVLDSTREKCSSFDKGPSSPQLNQIDCTQEPGRQKMGFKQKYQMSREQFKALEQYKEEYMAAALKLKEDLERKNMGDANEDEDDDDEDDDAEGKAQGGKDDKEPSVEQKSSTEVTSDDTNNEEKKSDAADESYEAKKVGNDKAVTDATIASPADVAVAESSNTFGHATVGETDKHIPTELAGKDFPDGWVYRRIPRQKANDPRTDRHYYSPKLGLRFRQRSDAMRFLAKLEEAKGDESVAIMKYLGKDKVAVKAASKVTTKTIAKVAPAAAEGDGVREEYDFTQDIPLAPELIRRCLAVVRTLCVSNTSDQFIYPVDPQLYPGYYETVMNPMSLYDIGKYLQEAGNKYSSNHDDPEIEEVVANVGRKVRILVQNSIMVNSSNMIVNSAEEMLRIFERLFFDWVLAPSRPDIEHLDDDRCVHHHESDINSMVLICDACEAKYNMTRLKPVLLRVPKGDWYCPRCVSGRSWLTADPRIGRSVKNESISGTVQSCKFLFTEDGKPPIIYCIKSINSGRIEYWGVEDVDNSMLGDPVEPLRCLQALAESPGYGFGRDSGIVGGAIPLAINPFVGDKAAQAALSSSGVFQDTVSACVYLTNSPEDFTAEEWTALLMLLVTKCSQSDALQELASKLESKEHSRLSTDMLTFWRARAAKNIVSNLSDDDSVLSEEEEPRCEPPSDIPTVIEGKAKTGVNESATKREEPPADIVMKSSGEEPTNMEISFSSSKTEALDEASSSTAANATIQSSMKETVISEEEVLRKKRDATLAAKTKRDSKREQALMGYYVGSRLKSTAASFDEDFISTAVKATLCNQEKGLDLPAVRCRESCHYCGVSDVALGAPLFRTPNEQEWREMFPLAVHNRTTFMIAEVPDNSSEDDPFHLGIKSPDKEEKKTKALCVRVRVGGELVSSKNTCIDNTGKNYDSVMQQFLPLNPKGFQSELKYRQRKNLSIISGSVAAHEVCAIAAYKSRKEKLLGERRTFHRSNMTREAALACGKSVPIGNDPFGRSYWVFSAEPSSLFICSNPPQASQVACKEWHRFNKPEDIAAVMVCLGKNPLCETLKEVFPEAKKFMKDRTWSTLIYGRCLAREPDESESQPAAEKPKIDEEQQDYGAPFVEDEDVLVESKEGKFLWDAVVVDVSKDPDTERVNGYLVHYKNWSSRFDQWVAPDRVVEPNKINTEVQGEVTQDFSDANDASPPMLEKMFAYQFLNAKKRARSTPATKTDIFETAFARPSASQDEKLLGLLKGAVLLIEAALPRGSVGSSKNGSWDHEAAAAWRNFVKDAQGPESLMKCVLLLEDAISPDWFHSQATQLYASLPKQWRAMGEASLSGIALRVSVLDRCLKYQQRKKKHLD